MPCGGAGSGDDRGKWASILGMLEQLRIELAVYV